MVNVRLPHPLVSAVLTHPGIEKLLGYNPYTTADMIQSSEILKCIYILIGFGVWVWVFCLFV